MEEQKKEFPKKTLFLIISILFNYVVPCVVLLIQFQFFKKTNIALKFTAVGIVVAFVLVFKLYKQLGLLIKQIKNDNWLIVISIIKYLVLGIVLTLSIQAMKSKLADLQTIVLVFCISWAIGETFAHLRNKEIKRIEKKEQDDNMRSIVREELERVGKQD